MAPVRAIIYGMGRAGQLAARYISEKGGVVVATHRRRPLDSGAQRGAGAGVPAVGLFVPGSADIVILTHGSRLDDIWGPAMQCAQAGLNALTLGDDTFDPFCLDQDLEIAMALDLAFRKHGCTLASGGFQDSFWFAQPLALVSAAQRLDRLECSNLCDLSQFGAAAQADLPIGETPEGFETWCRQNALSRRSVLDTALRPLLRRIGYDRGQPSITYEGLYARAELKLSQGGRRIAKGLLRGLTEKLRIVFSDGLVVCGDFTSAYLEPGEAAFNEWRVVGEPDLVMRSDNLRGAEAGVAAAINRIPEILLAPPGFIGPEHLPPAQFQRALTQNTSTKPREAHGSNHDQL